MATDVEESDTDEHERPAPSKRPRTRFLNSDHFRSSDREQPSETQSSELSESEEAERRARDKLKKWQACQVARGFVDNTINQLLEIHTMTPAASYSLEDPRIRLFCGTEMEDTAVMMAIQNHGLVQSAELVQSAQSFGCYQQDIRCFCPANRETIPSIVVGSVSNEPQLNEHQDESVQQHDFLERAVAEAIKKKGLSALSVEYG
ncbi:uncharacterized protein LOC107265394 [Cephus cinctus]|uniref:Uncharacterized protein LOC107265394 n=1 Tax=Cephus cinctus TaxID=211228 RepID=A0AAJ7FG84_CEPCN|nr:uncharacterized protein LOC107265394 [Cephus cinctus]